MKEEIVTADILWVPGCSSHLADTIIESISDVHVAFERKWSH